MKLENLMVICGEPMITSSLDSKLVLKRKKDRIDQVITHRLCLKLSLCVSYSFPKFDGPWKNEGVTFLVVPPNCTYTHLKLVSKKQLMFFLYLVVN
jgi:hypothetical protein